MTSDVATAGDRAARSPASTVAGAVALAPYLARIALVVLGLRQFVLAGATVGDVLALMLAPLWLTTLARFRGARTFALLGLVTVVGGLVLSDVTASDHAVNSTVRTSSTLLLAGIVLGVCVILWARTMLTVAETGLWFGIGMCARAVLDGPGDNPWKNSFAIPLAMVVLAAIAMIYRSGSRSGIVAGAVGLGAFGVVSAFSDARSYAATFLIAALLLAWQARPRGSNRRPSTLATTVLLAALVAATYWLGSHLLVAGYLGADAQTRTIDQIDQSGSLIVGGRPELQATIALMQQRPLGYGVGIEPTARDILVAKTGLNSINYNPNNGYVEKYMFGGRIELHSVFGDLWSGWGALGLLLLLFPIVVLARAIPTSIAHRRADPLLLFLCIWTLWNLFFSPIFGSAPTLTLALGLVPPLATRSRPDAGRAPARAT